MPMTKKELVEFLELFPDDAKVLVAGSNGGLDFDDIAYVIELDVKEYEGERPPDGRYHTPWLRNNEDKHLPDIKAILFH